MLTRMVCSPQNNGEYGEEIVLIRVGARWMVPVMIKLMQIDVSAML